MSRCVFISHWVKNISKKLSNEHYKVYIAQKLITMQGTIVDIAKNVNGILRKGFFRKKNLEQLRMCLLCVISKKKMRQFIHDDNFVLSNHLLVYFYSYMTIFKKIDFQPPNGILDTFVSA